MNRTLHASTIVALFALAACDPGDDELGPELEAELLTPGDIDDFETEILGIASELDFQFSGPCSDVSDRTGTGILRVAPTGAVRGIVFDDWYPGVENALPGVVDMDGLFTGTEHAKWGDCAWSGYVDVASDTAFGEWSCGYGCAGTWEH